MVSVGCPRNGSAAKLGAVGEEAIAVGQPGVVLPQGCTTTPRTVNGAASMAPAGDCGSWAVSAASGSSARQWRRMASRWRERAIATYVAPASEGGARTGILMAAVVRAVAPPLWTEWACLLEAMSRRHRAGACVSASCHTSRLRSCRGIRTVQLGLLNSIGRSRVACGSSDRGSAGTAVAPSRSRQAVLKNDLRLLQIYENSDLTSLGGGRVVLFT
jgi:hypothetical protein